MTNSELTAKISELQNQLESNQAEIVDIEKSIAKIENQYDLELRQSLYGKPEPEMPTQEIKNYESRIEFLHRKSKLIQITLGELFSRKKADEEIMQCRKMITYYETNQKRLNEIEKLHSKLEKLVAEHQDFAIFDYGDILSLNLNNNIENLRNSYKYRILTYENQIIELSANS